MGSHRASLFNSFLSLIVSLGVTSVCAFMKSFPALLIAALGILPSFIPGWLAAEEDVRQAPVTAPLGIQPGNQAPPADEGPVAVKPGNNNPGDQTRELPLLPQENPPAETQAPPSTETQTTFFNPRSLRKKKVRLTKTEMEEDLLLQRIRFYEARTRAEQDPRLAPILHEAKSARTQYEERDAYTRYYTVLFDDIAKLDKRFPVLLATTRTATLNRYKQVRIRPTEPPVPLQNGKKPAGH